MTEPTCDVACRSCMDLRASLHRVDRELARVIRERDAALDENCDAWRRRAKLAEAEIESWRSITHCREDEIVKLRKECGEYMDRASVAEDAVEALEQERDALRREVERLRAHDCNDSPTYEDPAAKALAARGFQRRARTAGGEKTSGNVDRDRRSSGDGTGVPDRPVDETTSRGADGSESPAPIPVREAKPETCVSATSASAAGRTGSATLPTGASSSVAQPPAPEGKCEKCGGKGTVTVESWSANSTPQFPGSHTVRCPACAPQPEAREQGECNCATARFEDDPCPVHGPEAREHKTEVMPCAAQASPTAASAVEPAGRPGDASAVSSAPKSAGPTSVYAAHASDDRR